MKRRKIIQSEPKNSNLIVGNPIINRIFQIRGVESASELDLNPRSLVNPFALKDMNKACDVLIDHFYEQSKVIIVGDFDCDGATSTSIMKEGLSLLGFENVIYDVPDRQIHGYGLTDTIAMEVCEKSPDLIITVDCGISSFDGAEYIKEFSEKSGKHIDLIITDHHLQTANGLIPPCAAAINPNQNADTSGLKNLAGCGVAFYTITALRSKMRELGIFNTDPRFNGKEPDMRILLDLVSLGTVADLVKLDKNNRILVNMGLNLVKSGNGRPAINAILDKNKYTSSDTVKASDWGFNVGPVINAAGRLESMTKGINALLCRDQSLVGDMVDDLIEINEMRKSIGKDMEDFSLSALENYSYDKGVVLYNPEWHEGVVGIVASRVKDAANRPSICLTALHETKEIIDIITGLEYSKADKSLIEQYKRKLDDSMIKGSCRSIPGVHLKHILDEINANHPKLIAKFGGHAMAAGITLKYGNLEEFTRLFDEGCNREITPEMISGDILVDYKDIPSDYLTVDFVKEIDSYAPWGKDFDYPRFSARFKIVQCKPIGNELNHMRFILQHEMGGNTIVGVMWKCVDDPNNIPFQKDDVVEASFELQINEYNGFVSPQIKIDYIYNFDHELRMKRSKEELINER